MHPRGRNHRADALRDHREVFFLNSVSAGDMVTEGLHVPCAGGKTGAVTSWAGRLAMSTGVPGEEIKLRQVEFIDHMGDTPRVLVTAMK